MVATFYPPYAFGGDAFYVEALARALVGRGHDVTVVHCVDAFRLKSHGPALDSPAEEMRDGVRIHRLRSPLGLLSPLLTQQTGYPLLKARRLRAILASGFDVVNFHNISLVGGPAVLALPAAGACKIWTVHEHWLMCSTHIFWKNGEKPCDSRQCFTCCLRSGTPPQAWRLTSLAKKSLAHLNAVIAPSRYTADLYRPRVAPVEVHVLQLYSRIAPARAATAGAPAREGDAPERAYFLYVGRITAPKGIRPLLLQFRDRPDLRLVVAGEGDLLPALRAEFGACDNIEFKGFVPPERLAALYSGALAVIVPSLAPESFGLAAVEAMACGTPVVVRDAGGCREIVDLSGGGIVFTAFSALPGILASIAGDPSFRRRLAVAAQEASRHFTVDRHLDSYLALCANIGPAGGPGGRRLMPSRSEAT